MLQESICPKCGKGGAEVYPERDIKKCLYCKTERPMNEDDRIAVGVTREGIRRFLKGEYDN